MPEDYPRVRADLLCPCCGQVKGLGIVACWLCYRRLNMRNGNKSAEATIATREKALEILAAHPLTEATAAGAQYVLPGAAKKQARHAKQTQLLF